MPAVAGVEEREAARIDPSGLLEAMVEAVLRLDRARLARREIHHDELVVLALRGDERAARIEEHGPLVLRGDLARRLHGSGLALEPHDLRIAPVAGHDHDRR